MKYSNCYVLCYYGEVPCKIGTGGRRCIATMTWRTWTSFSAAALQVPPCNPYHAYLLSLRFSKASLRLASGVFVVCSPRMLAHT